MSFKANQNQQITLHDSFINQTPRTQKLIMKSWCKDFADIVFPAINEERFAVLYSGNDASRPNTPVNVIIGALMLKENNGLNDEELVESICCDVRFQYALHTTHMQEQPVSDRTFSRFRERLYHYEMETGRNLLKDEMLHLADVYAKYMGLNSNLKRMDSLMVASRCRHMSRLEIIYQATANAVRLIHRLGSDSLLTADLQHYLDADDLNQVIYYCKSEDVAPRLEKALQEAVKVKEAMHEELWHGFPEYQLLARALSEQGKVDGEGKAIPKEKGEIAANSLQNPSDPDATYRSKGGRGHKGYVGNVLETVGEDGDSLVTGVGYEVNSHSDSEFCKEYLESRPDGAEPEILVTDGGYGGKRNQALAKEKNTKLVTTALTGKAVGGIFSGFRFSEDGERVISCPMGHAPLKTTYYPKNGVCRARFAKECCGECPHREECRCRPQKKSFAVHVSAGMAERARHMAEASTDEYIKLARKRNAVEGVMSVLRRRYHIDRMPVFGYLRSRQFFLLKIGAYNFNKLLGHNRRIRGKSALQPAIA